MEIKGRGWVSFIIVVLFIAGVFSLITGVVCFDRGYNIAKQVYTGTLKMWVSIP